MRRTQDAVDAVSAWELETSVHSAMEPNAGTHFDASCPMNRAAEYQHYGQTLPTGYVRGRVCAYSERAAGPALASDDPLADGSLVVALNVAVVAH